MPYPTPGKKLSICARAAILFLAVTGSTVAIIGALRSDLAIVTAGLGSIGGSIWVFITGRPLQNTNRLPNFNEDDYIEHE